MWVLNESSERTAGSLSCGVISLAPARELRTRYTCSRFKNESVSESFNRAVAVKDKKAKDQVENGVEDRGEKDHLLPRFSLWAFWVGWGSHRRALR